MSRRLQGQDDGGQHVRGGGELDPQAAQHAASGSRRRHRQRQRARRACGRRRAGGRVGRCTFPAQAEGQTGGSRDTGQHGVTGGGFRDAGSTRRQEVGSGTWAARGDRRWVQGRGQHGGQEVGAGMWAARGTGGGFRDVGSTGDRRWAQGSGQHGETGGGFRDVGSTGDRR